uniref:Peptidase M16 N-terminal domain-containing protein n=1 Tax=Plectus sambesii TaxID=2011161 RepID=A0A914UMC4_9BILA
MVASSVVSRNDAITKSPLDDRQYRAIVLENGLNALLVSDEHADKCAASLDIAVGAMTGPRDMPGLAHFCEHMLFLGTDKYPAENEFQKYIAMHGGQSNAITYSDHTNYYFEVAPAYLEVRE